MNDGTPASRAALYRQTTTQWPGLTTTYAWLPPDQAIGLARPNQVEVVFTAHAHAAYACCQHAQQLTIAPGTACIVGSDAVLWTKIDAPNESLSMYPDLALLHRLAQPTTARRIELATQVDCHDPVFLGIAHVFRQACATGQPISDLHASTLAHRLSHRLLETYCGVTLPEAHVHGSRLSESAIRTTCDYIEAHLDTQITLDHLAALVHLSPCHFARCFKATTGISPHQYVLARRIEFAKRLLLTTDRTVAAIAWTIGYENISHFRRLFVQHVGVTPGVVRRAASTRHA